MKGQIITHNKYNPTESYQFILLDLETSDTGKNAEICQLSAIAQTGATYSSYIIPNGNISSDASRVNKLTVEEQDLYLKTHFLSKQCH